MSEEAVLSVSEETRKMLSHVSIQSVENFLRIYGWCREPIVDVDWVRYTWSHHDSAQTIESGTQIDHVLEILRVVGEVSGQSISALVKRLLRVAVEVSYAHFYLPENTFDSIRYSTVTDFLRSSNFAPVHSGETDELWAKNEFVCLLVPYDDTEPVFRRRLLRELLLVLGKESGFSTPSHALDALRRHTPNHATHQIVEWRAECDRLRDENKKLKEKLVSLETPPPSVMPPTLLTPKDEVEEDKGRSLFRASVEWLDQNRNKDSFQGLWVALRGDTLLAWDPSRARLHEKLGFVERTLETGDDLRNVLVYKIGPTTGTPVEWKPTIRQPSSEEERPPPPPPDPPPPLQNPPPRPQNPVRENPNPRPRPILDGEQND